MAYVPSSPIAALAENTTPGKAAGPQIMDDAMNAVVQTINENYDTAQATNEVIGGHKVSAVLDHPDQSVTAVKIKDLNITTVKLADQSVTAAKIAIRGITSDRIANGGVGAVQLDPALLQNFGDIAVQAKFVKVDSQLADIAINVKQYGAVGDGVTDDTVAVQLATTAASDRRLEVNSDFNCRVTGTINLPSNIVIACNGKFTCDGDADYWFQADTPESVIYEQITVEVVKPFAERTLLNRVLYCNSPTYFEVMTADIRGATTAIHCQYGEDFVCGDILLHEVLGVDAQSGYGVNSSCKRNNIKSVTAINSDTTNGRHAIYINGDIWESANIDSVYVYNFNKHPVNIANTDVSASCYAYIRSAVFINCNIEPTADTSGCIHLTSANGPGVRLTVDDVRVKGIAGPAFSSQGQSDGVSLGNLYAEDLLPSTFVNIYLVNIRNGNNNQIGKVFCTALNTNWMAAIFFRDTVNATLDDLYLGGATGGSAVRLNGADAMLGNIQTASLSKIAQTGVVTIRYKDNRLTGSVSWNPASLADGAGETSTTITVTGAALGDYVVASAPYDLQGIICSAYVSAANTVIIRIQNETGGVIDLASGTWKVRVIKDL